MNDATWIIDSARQFGPWVAYTVAALWLLDKTGVLGWLHRAHRAVIDYEHQERQLLSADWQATLQRHDAEIQRLRADRQEERAADKAECEQRIAAVVADYSGRIETLRVECEGDRKKLLAVTASMESGNRRWRHLTMNLFQYLEAMHGLLKKAGIEIPPFDGWRLFIAEGGDLPFDPHAFSATSGGHRDETG